MTDRKNSFRSALRKGIAIGLCYTCSISFSVAQEAIEPVRPRAPIILRPYEAPEIPPIRPANSGRLRDLVRAGRLYLTVQDAIALTLENNIDIEVARYNPILAEWRLERSEAGGALPGVPSGASQANSIASGQGVAGSQAAAGVNISGTSTGSAGVGNATITQVGPVTQNLDPSLQGSTVFGHKTAPQANVIQSVIPVLISNTRVYNGTLTQGLLTGGSVSANYNDHYLRENAPTDFLNPSSSATLSVSFQHNLLRGFGRAVNGRTITVSRINFNTSDLNFKTQVIGTVVQALNLYYNLVAGNEDVKAKTVAVEAARALYEDNKKRVEFGELAPLEVTRAESQVANSERDMVISQTGLQQQEVQLKNLISRTGTADPVLAQVQIVPVDRIVVPDKDDLPPLKELVQKALADRSDLAAEKAGVTTAEVSALGTRNGVLPSLQVFGTESHAGLAGSPRTVISQGGAQTADRYFVGSIGDALGQIFRRNFPTERIGAFFQAPLGNNQAQGDYGIDQLQLRQTQLTTQRDLNQVEVDVANDVISLKQARARYDAAARNRVLQQELLDAEQKKYSLGASTPYNVIQQQRDLVAAQSTELSALVAYSMARVALDQALGATLETNHVTIAEARAGKVARTSSAPAPLP
jgi:outer membrane protein